jgi:hypothetical protein
MPMTDSPLGDLVQFSDLGSTIGLIIFLWLLTVRLGRWATPLATSYIAAHVEMTKQVIATQEEMLTLMSTIDGRLAKLESANKP